MYACINFAVLNPCCFGQYHGCWCPVSFHHQVINSHDINRALANPCLSWENHYNDVIMDVMASQITSLTIVYSTVNSVTDQRKHQSSTSLAFVRGIHRWPVNSPHKGPVTRKMFPFDDVIMYSNYLNLLNTEKYLPTSDCPHSAPLSTWPSKPWEYIPWVICASSFMISDMQGGGTPFAVTNREIMTCVAYVTKVLLYLSLVRINKKKSLLIWYHVHIWKILLQLSCGYTT